MFTFKFLYKIFKYCERNLIHNATSVASVCATIRMILLQTVRSHVKIYAFQIYLDCCGYLGNVQIETYGLHFFF